MRLPLVVAASLVVPLSAQGLRVLSSSPANNAIAAPAGGLWEVSFDRPVDPASLAGNVGMFGRWSGVVAGQTGLDAAGTRLSVRPSRPLFAGEVVMVSLTRNVRALDATTLQGGFAAWYFVAPAPGPATFSLARTLQLRTGTPTITYGVHAIDLDRDGSPDITSANEATHDLRIFKNDGCGVPGPMTIVAGHGFPSPTEAADFDRDGWPDLCSANLNGNSIAVFFNDGTGNLQAPLVITVGGRSHGITVLDADADGLVDIAATNSSNALFFRNLGNRSFAPAVATNAGNDEDNIMAADANGDGWPDLFVGCESGQTAAVLLGDGAGGFALQSSRACGGAAFQIAVGDVDGDGDCDALTANRNSSTCGILRNDGAGNLAPVTTITVGSVPVAADYGDLDGDGDLDIVISCYGNARHYLLTNLGAGTFGPARTLPTTQNASCATVVDFDRDGLVDLISADEGSDELRIYLQDRPVLANVQPLSCLATLRVDSHALAGFGGRPSRPVRAGGTAFFSLTGAASQPFALLLGPGVEPGVPYPFGLANLDAANSGTLVLGFAGDPRGITDAAGEAIVGVPVPAGLGGVLSTQAVILDPRPNGNTLLFTNPVGMAFVP